MTATFKLEYELPVAPQFKKEANLKEYEQAFKDIILSRIKHCKSELDKHLLNDTAYIYYDNMVVYKDGGHFNRAVFTLLTKAVHRSIEEWNILIWQQIIRQMYTESIENTYESKLLFNIATEQMLVLYLNNR